MLLTFTLRSALRSFAVSRTYPRLPVRLSTPRTFSTTSRRRAAEVPDDFINAIKHTPLFQKLADKPDALKALSDLYSLTKEMGLDINSTTPPSQYQMFKLVTNRRFVRVVKRVMEELNAAGLKLNSDDALQEIMGLTQGKPQKKDDS
ncbi:hypothetical protein B0F90DRAFT_1813773 [Multifurca ochricompacta]|uniref:Uncharacterized protein n=1 Tax=Multifurca ochricompacta TaxID=376703 RepID=A0AAD4QPI9_9AGAM|nr:hypothetical protein B0F90DRAFT_1813773 [Multifurca ochricompacta]